MTVLLYSVMHTISYTWVIELVVEAICSQMLRAMSCFPSTELILHPLYFPARITCYVSGDKSCNMDMVPR